jgi:CubicO group peptidase (beta-lactamase class C family)
MRQIAPAARAPYGAGGVNASAADLSRWLRMIIAGGTIDGTRVVDANVIAAMLAPQTVARQTIWTPGANFVAYGLGWFLHDYRGHKVAQHAGSAEGWSAVVGIVPDQRLGVAVVSNLNSTILPHAVLFRVIDSYLGDPVRDWSAQWLEAERKARAAQSAPPPPAAAAPVPDAYVGVYEHPAYGAARVTIEQGGVVLRYGPQVAGDLRFVKDDAFSVEWRDVSLRVLTGRPVIRFRRGATGVDAITLELADDRIEFVRR